MYTDSLSYVVMVPVIWDDVKVNVLDTPGYFDFVGEAQEAAAAADESLPSFPDIRKWNAEAVLTVPRVAYGDGERAKERLARQYRAVLSKAAEAGYRTLSIAPLSDYPLDLEGEIAASSVNAFFAFNPSSPMSVTFVLPHN